MSFTKESALIDAKKAAKRIKTLMKGFTPKIGLVLGTGWGGALALDGSMPFKQVHSTFKTLGELEGHARNVIWGEVAGVPVVALQGRVHLNERSCDQKIYSMVRLQMQMLLELGVRTFILTCAAGSLRPPSDPFSKLIPVGARSGRRVSSLPVGSVMAIDGFVLSRTTPPMPLFGGEFISPDDKLDPHLRELAQLAGHNAGLQTGVTEGGYAMMLGPDFEGRMYDKLNIAKDGARCVGMSTRPECCIAALYPGTKVVALAFITNDDIARHSHEQNQRVAKASQDKLGRMLELLVGYIEKDPF